MLTVALQVLEEICNKMGWTPPVYAFMKSNSPIPQFCCRVRTIPLLIFLKDIS